MVARHLAGDDVEKSFDDFIGCGFRVKTVEAQKAETRRRRDAFVAVNKSVRLTQMETVSRRALDRVGLLVISAVFRRVQSRFERALVAQTGRAAETFDVELVNFENFFERKEGYLAPSANASNAGA